MDENKNVPAPKDFNQSEDQIKSVFYAMPRLVDYMIEGFYHKDLWEQQKEQDKIAMNDGLAYYDYTKKQLIYFKDIDDPKLKIEAHKEADREQQQKNLFDCVLEELKNNQISLEDTVIEKNTDTNYFNEEFFHYWDKYSDDIRRAGLLNFWARMLVREMQNPQTISIRTMEFVKTISKRDAHIFNMILPYVIGNGMIPYIYNVIHSLDLQHLEHLGLLLGNRAFILEKGAALALGKQALISNEFNFSSYSLSDIGKELYLIADVGDYDIDKLEEIFDNDNLVNEGDRMTFHKMLNETECDPTPFRMYQKTSPKNDIIQKYFDLPRLSLKPNI